MNYVDEFKQQLKKEGISKHTVKNYTADVKRFYKWYAREYSQEFDPEAVTTKVITRYSDLLKGRISASSAERNFSSIRRFFAFLQHTHFPHLPPFSISEIPLRAEDPWLFKAFKDHLILTKRSQLTIKNYIIDLSHFVEWIQVNQQQTPTLSDESALMLLESYGNHLSTREAFSANSLNRKLTSVRQYLSWLTKERLLDKALLEGRQPQHPLSYQIIRNIANEARQPSASERWNRPVSTSATGYFSRISSLLQQLKMTGNKYPIDIDDRSIDNTLPVKEVTNNTLSHVSVNDVSYQHSDIDRNQKTYFRIYLMYLGSGFALSLLLFAGVGLFRQPHIQSQEILHASVSNTRAKILSFQGIIRNSDKPDVPVRFLVYTKSSPVESVGTTAESEEKTQEHTVNFSAPGFLVGDSDINRPSAGSSSTPGVLSKIIGERNTDKVVAVDEIFIPEESTSSLTPKDSYLSNLNSIENDIRANSSESTKKLSLLVDNEGLSIINLSDKPALARIQPDGKGTFTGKLTLREDRKPTVYNNSIPSTKNDSQSLVSTTLSLSLSDEQSELPSLLLSKPEALGGLVMINDGKNLERVEGLEEVTISGTVSSYTVAPLPPGDHLVLRLLSESQNHTE